ncbi:GTP 3',8-cyclase MoaA [Pseudoalteromonas aliena]|uniref:GTP 3',8-cyclase MoaA n=1 Tax=Pseudoalteromonas aliena TaxID=247523 RepID=UPI00311D8873
MLIDPTGREFSYLRLSITDVCNFKCVYCLPDGYQGGHDRGFLTIDEISNTLKAFAHHGIEKVRITGGEPTLRKDFIDVVRAAKDVAGIKKIAMTTNGFSLHKNIHDWVGAGLNAINVSIDSLDSRMFNTITGHDKFTSVMKGIDTALETGIDSVKINSVLMKQYNAKEFDTFLNWVKHRPVTIRFIELMQTNDNKAFFDANHVSGQVLKTQLLQTGWQQVARSASAGPAQEFAHPDYEGKIGLIMPYSNDFCSTCNRLRVTAKGNLHLCLFSEEGISLREYMNDSSNSELMALLSRYIKTKKPTHLLHQGNTGITTNLSMLGG